MQLKAGLIGAVSLSLGLGCVDHSNAFLGEDMAGDIETDIHVPDLTLGDMSPADAAKEVDSPDHIFCTEQDKRWVESIKGPEFFIPNLPFAEPPPENAFFGISTAGSAYSYEAPAYSHTTTGVWHEGTGGLKMRLGDHYAFGPRGDYQAVVVLVDHKPVEADYFRRRDGQLEYFGRSKFYKFHDPEVTEWVDVHLPPEVFPEHRTYDLVVVLFRNVNSRASGVELKRISLFYGGYDVPSHPCFVPPPTEEPAFTDYERAFIEEWENTDQFSVQEAIYVYKDGGEIVTREADTVIEVEADAVSVDLNAIFRYSMPETTVHRWNPMKIIALVDYEHIVEEWVWGMPFRESRLFGHDFFRRETFEVPLNPGPETTLWMLGIPHPWIPTFSPEGERNLDISHLYWAHRSNRIILRRK